MAHFYLTAAKELRRRARAADPERGQPRLRPGDEHGAALRLLAVRLNGSKAGDRTMTLGLTLSDIGESWTLMVRNGALSHRAGEADDTDVTVTIARSDLNDVILGTARWRTRSPTAARSSTASRSCTT